MVWFVSVIYCLAYGFWFDFVSFVGLFGCLYTLFALGFGGF